MGLKSILSKKENNSGEYYWSIVIEPKWIQAGLWVVSDHKVKVVSKSVPVAWELDEELVNAADSVLSSVVQELEDDISEPSKTVFGVVSSWVENGQIKDKYLEKIKHLCTELSLKPAGFVVLSEAIANFIKSEEGGAFSGITLGMMDENLEVGVFDQGEVVGSTKVARSMSLVDDVIEGLTRIIGENKLPSRIVLYDGKEGEIEDARQSLIQANWDISEKVKFLHTPKIESFTSLQKLNSVCLAGAVDIANVSSIEKMEDDVPSLSGSDSESEDASTEDISSSKEIESEDNRNIEDISPEELGFTINSDIEETEKNDSKVHNPSDGPKEPDANSLEKTTTAENGKKMKSIRFKLNLKSMFEKIFKKKEKTAIGSSPTGAKRAMIIGGVILFLLVIGGFSFWWFYPKATVTIYLSTTSLDEKVTINVDSNATDPNFTDAVLPGTVVTTEVSGEKSSQTTGTKVVGDKATGEVVLYRVGSAIDIDGGTAITGPGNLEFILDDDVSVASGSASSPGKTTAKVTASSIGSEFNLASGSTFEVDSYSLSDIEARSESAFSGGSSNEISAVSEEDQKQLEDALTKELKDNALADLENKLASQNCSNCVLIKDSFDVSDSSTKFSNKVGDEATNLKLNLTEQIKALAVNENDLISFAKELLKDRIPDGYVLRDDQVKVDFKFKETSGDIYKVDASITANLFPQIDPDEVTKKIVGKYPQLAEDYFVNEIPGFARAEINLHPKLRGRLKTLPHVAKNIEVEIAAER